ncbi:natterin-3-like [Notolabrus celidotus]|uniref:natterin-3-like n=1 Tax=Notolabrus celidotus TaxID=1203425 RepID=UPI00148FB64A|nr:natterin-3-like [Notolabrus celidotus]
MDMMKLSVFVLLALLALLALSSANPLDVRSNTEQRNGLSGSHKTTLNGSMGTDQPSVNVAKFRQKRQVQSSPNVPVQGTILEWVPWNNSLPNGAVSIYNDYVGRTEYVCKYKCHAGFYNPNNNVPYCYYPNQKKEHAGSPFALLVNRDNFEILEWKDDSKGSVPKNSVRTCPDEDIYVGKNKYGLGKVVTEDKAFYLPWKGSEYRYSDNQVLTFNEKVLSQRVDNVRYITDEYKIFNFPPETLYKTTLSNYECHPVVKTDTISKTYQVTQRWDVDVSARIDFKTDFKAKVPVIVSVGVELGAELFFQYSKGNTVTDTITDTISMDITAPPNHSCAISMMRYKYKLTIPFTARLSRTYGSGEVHTTSMTGTYSSVKVGEVRAVVDRCEGLPDAKTCT